MSAAVTGEGAQASSLADELNSRMSEMDLSVSTFGAGPTLDQAWRDVQTDLASAVDEIAVASYRRRKPGRKMLAEAQPSARSTIQELMARQNIDPSDRKALEDMARAPRITTDQLAALVGLHRKIARLKPL